MQFSLSPSSLLALAASFALATAQNAFTMTTIPSTIHAGSPFNLTWGATTPGDVSIWLVQGPSSNTKYVATVAANITNSGNFVWTPSSSLPSGSGYALEIVSDSNPYITNWSGQFALDGGSSSVDSSSPSNSTASTTSAGSSSSGSSSATKSASGTAKTTMATATSSTSGSTASPSTTSTVPNTNANAAERVGASGFALVVLLAGAFIAL